ncbi:MAG TPA: phage scaffolding protein [Ornithinicoccus sp.]|nr:phage scaffolding protein [Ornithinicoccus sp.]
MENEELARLLGHLPDGTPIWHQIGFAPDDDDEGGEDDEGQDDDTDEDDEDEWTPPSREEWERQQRQLARARKEAAKRRKALKARQDDDEDELDDDEDDDKGSGKPADRRELKRLLARAEARVEAKYKPALVKQAAKSALVEAGFAGEVTSRTMRMLDLDDLEVDDEGEIIGLDEAIEELKEDMPQLFKRSRNGSGSSSRTSAKTTGRRSLDGGNKRTAKKEPTFAEKLAAQLGK